MISPETIQKVREVDIESVLSRYIKFERKKSKCPFHNEKSASLSIKESEQIYKCFGCGAGGDAINFVMRHERMEFEEAIETIAEIGGITVEYEEHISEEQLNLARKSAEERKSVRKILMEAHTVYQDALWANEEALAYLRTDRGMTDEQIRDWGLGYAPAGGRFLANRYSNEGLLPVAAKAGLVRDKEMRHYDVYQYRIIIPIYSHRGELATFAGRSLAKESKFAKYINGYASDLYDKSKILFGLDKALEGIKLHRHAILVEGYFDVISMHAAGATNTVCACGTSVTEDQLKLLRRYTESILLIPDNDMKPDGTNPGIEAAQKILPVLLSMGFKVDIFVIPASTGKQDPDDFARAFIVEQLAENKKKDAEPTNCVESKLFVDGGFTAEPELTDTVDTVEDIEFEDVN